MRELLPPHGREADGVVPSHDHRHRSRCRHVRDGVGNLIERLLDVRRNRENVPRVAHGHLLPQVYPGLVVVWCVYLGAAAP